MCKKNVQKKFAVQVIKNLDGTPGPKCKMSFLKKKIGFKYKIILNALLLFYQFDISRRFEHNSQISCSIIKSVRAICGEISIVIIERFTV